MLQSTFSPYFFIFFLENYESIHVRTKRRLARLAPYLGGSIAAAAAPGSAGEPGQLSRGRSQAQMGRTSGVPWGDGRNPPLGQHENIINEYKWYMGIIQLEIISMNLNDLLLVFFLGRPIIGVKLENSSCFWQVGSYQLLSPSVLQVSWSRPERSCRGGDEKSGVV